MEACLEAQDGVTPFTLLDKLKLFLDSSDALPMALRPWAPVLLQQVRALPLHSVVQLLLTTAVATRPHTLPHSVQAMALAGAMACRSGSVLDIRLAMLGGLLHDIGEVYIQPSYLDSSDLLDLAGYKHVAAHPRAAQLLLSSSTDYPETLSRAIGEHHERLDGSGYPARLHADKISPLGRLLAVVEVTMGIMRAPVAPLTRASFALLPGEFDPKWTGLVCDVARDAGEVLQSQQVVTQADLGATMQEIETHTQRARQVQLALQRQHPNSSAMDIANTAVQRLARLRVAWNGLGIWGLDTQENSAQEQFEIEMASKELKQHLRELQRECLLLAERLTQTEREAAEPLWDGLLKR
jgi:HD-GYP domain-containing protein (c-di-GMP phosphodiesterase class II)